MTGRPATIQLCIFLCAAVAALTLPSPLAAQSLEELIASGRRVLTAEPLRSGERIRLDGVLDEEAWGRAPTAGEFIQQDPVFGGAPTERTDVRVVFSAEHLYIGVICYDSEPDRLLGNTRKRDEFLSADDRFMWTIDTFLNQQTGYFFEMNPSGLMADALMGPGGSTNREWDGIWNARVRRSEVGWTIEIDLPFRSLAFDPGAPAWGINFQRTVRRKNEELLWTGHQRNQGLRRMSNAGLLVGLTGVQPGRGLELRPYIAANRLDAPGRSPGTAGRTAADIGGEIAYNLTPSLRAVGTINTDFAETEVDTRRVNLTRFPLFFPEKRSFFLDGATFFDFPNQPFFSRRIGLDENGEPQRIDGGAKLTGQAGAHDVGFLYVRTGEERGVLGEDFLVGRLRRRVLRQSYIGMIYTGRATRGQQLLDTRQTVGADLRLATSTFRGNQNLDFLAHATWATPPGGGANSSNSGDSGAWGAELRYPNDRWDGGVEFNEVQRNHLPALGFTPRRGYRQYRPSLRFGPRTQQHPLVRRVSVGGEVDLYTDTANQLVTREIGLGLGRVEFHSGDNFEAEMVPTRERLERDFRIADGITLPAGRAYSFTRYRLSAATANKRIFAVRPRVEWGSFFSGHRTQQGLELGVRPRPGVTLNFAGEWNRVVLAEGRFQTRLFRAVADTQFSPFMYLVNNLQFDSVSRALGWQSRFRWIVRPGNDIFVVYTHNWVETLLPDPRVLTPDRRFLTLDRRAAMKAVYTKRF